MLSKRLIFGGRKYAAFNLMLARWLQGYSGRPIGCHYVTMGGTELFDVANINWMGNTFIKSISSYEENHDRYQLAEQTAVRFRDQGVDVTTIEADIFRYERVTNAPHIFFIDLQGVFTSGQYGPSLRRWLLNEVILPGDFLLITSYLGRNRGWDKTLSRFSSEFKLLRLYNTEDRISTYRKMHPAFILYRELASVGYSDELSLRCLGYIKYRDTSIMGLYGFTWDIGSTDLSSLVDNVPSFDMVDKVWVTGCINHKASGV